MSCVADLHLFPESSLSEFLAAAKPLRQTRWFRKPLLLYPVHDWLKRNAREAEGFAFSGYVVCELVDSLHEFGFSPRSLRHASIAKAIDPQGHVEQIWTRAESQELAAFLAGIGTSAVEEFYRSGKSTLFDDESDEDMVGLVEAMSAAVKWLAQGLQSVREGEVAYLTAG